MGWTGPHLVPEAAVPDPTRPGRAAVAPSTRDLVIGHISYSCLHQECGRCSTYPGKMVDKHPRGSGVKLPASEIAPSCTHGCHKPDTTIQVL